MPKGKNPTKEVESSEATSPNSAKARNLKNEGIPLQKKGNQAKNWQISPEVGSNRDGAEKEEVGSKEKVIMESKEPSKIRIEPENKSPVDQNGQNENILNDDSKSLEDSATKNLILSWLNSQSPKYKPWAGLSDKGVNSRRIVCNWCSKDLAIDSLYGEKGHLKNPEHQKKQELWDIGNKKSQDLTFKGTQIKKVKLFEVDLCNLLVHLNLPFTNVEPLLLFLKNTLFQLRSNTLLLIATLLLLWLRRKFKTLVFSL